MGSFIELPISLTAVVVILGILGAFLAYRFRRGPLAVALAVVAALGIGCGVIWTVLPA